MIIITAMYKVQNMTLERPLLTFPRVIFVVVLTPRTAVFRELNKTIAVTVLSRHSLVC